MIFEKLQGIMEENLSIERDEIKLDSTFQSLGIDSLDTFQLIIEIEEAFDIQVEEAEKIKTVEEAVKYVESKIEK